MFWVLSYNVHAKFKVDTWNAYINWDNIVVVITCKLLLLKSYANRGVVYASWLTVLTVRLQFSRWTTALANL